MAAVVVIALVRGTTAQSSTFAVVVSPKNVLTNLSLGELRKILSGDKRSWPDGTRIKLFSRGPGTPERTALLKLLGNPKPSRSNTGPGRFIREKPNLSLWFCLLWNAERGFESLSRGDRPSRLGRREG